MSSKHVIAAAVALACLALAGCDEQKAASTGSAAPKSSAAPSAVAAKSATPAATAAATAAAPADGELALPEDFEEQVEKEIGMDNAESELAALEKEIQATP